ncbi:hypothetical protein PsorP6_011280 [Peronosclerospora sorghi]|uniref:Uncharacterized protein n=1 Tax=Peronosclerospora sorghi TaxID=230839 RepID=A0ACC0WKA8_9STRA|nr:hypothetical protein PsorP6_011280 [Peronosclerospora sorghi]
MKLRGKVDPPRPSHLCMPRQAEDHATGNHHFHSVFVCPDMPFNICDRVWRRMEHLQRISLFRIYLCWWK